MRKIRHKDGEKKENPNQSSSTPTGNIAPHPYPKYARRLARSGIYRMQGEGSCVHPRMYDRKKKRGKNRKREKGKREKREMKKRKGIQRVWRVLLSVRIRHGAIACCNGHQRFEALQLIGVPRLIRRPLGDLFHPVDPLGSVHSFYRWRFGIGISLVFTRGEGPKCADVGMHNSVNMGWSAFVDGFPSVADRDWPVVPAVAPRFTSCVGRRGRHGVLMASGNLIWENTRHQGRKLGHEVGLALKAYRGLLGAGREGLVRLARPCSCGICGRHVDLQPVQTAIQVRTPLRSGSVLALCSRLNNGWILREPPGGFCVNHHWGWVARRGQTS